MNLQRSKRYQAMNENLNKVLGKYLENFGNSTEWTDINSWLINVESLFRDYPTPFIADKVLLSKRLNQCMNPVLPEKIHEAVIRIHGLLFRNMKQVAEGDINEFIRSFGQDLGVYSVSLLPHFVHTNNFEHRIMILKLISSHYLLLGRQLIPMLPGLLKSLLSVYGITPNSQLIGLIEATLFDILEEAGRRYVIGCVWSLVLKYKDCKQPGIKFLSKAIPKLEHLEGQEDQSQERGFSDLQREIEEMERLQANPTDPENFQMPSKSSKKLIEKHIKKIESLEVPDISMVSPIVGLEQTPDKMIQVSEFYSESEKKFLEPAVEPNKLQQISEEPGDEQRQDRSKHEPAAQSKKTPGKEVRLENSEELDDEISQIPQNLKLVSSKSNKVKRMYQSQVPFGKSRKMTGDEEEISLSKVPLMTSTGMAQLKEGIDDCTNSNNYPQPSSLVLNALIACLQEDEPLTKRTVLDFMCTHLRIRSEVWKEHDKGVLVESLLRLFRKKEISISKRVNRWIFGRENEDNEFEITEKNEFIVKYIEQGLRNILSTRPTTAENCTHPLKILQNFYIEHSQLVKVTLHALTPSILRYIYNYGSSIEGKPNPFPHAAQVLKIGKRFLQNLPSYYSIIFQSLGQAFLEGVESDNEEKAFEAVRYIDFCFITLMQHEHSYDELEYITIILRYICRSLAEIVEKSRQDHKRTIFRVYLQDSILLMCNLVERRKGVIKLSRKQQEEINIKYYEETGETILPPERVQYQQQLQQREAEQQEKYIGICADFETFFIELGRLIKAYANVHQYEESFKLSAMTIVKMQLHLPHRPLQSLPKWFSALQGGIKVHSPLVSLAAIEAMIRSLMWEGKHPVYASMKSMMMQEKVNKVGVDYQKIALEKLWSLLDYPHMHGKIIELIVSFSKYFPNQFTDTVKKSFRTQNDPDKEASIQRFSHFWRLTGGKYHHLLTSHKQFAQLNKVGLFKMLDFLDDANPLVRHAAKNWLIESMNLLTRVIEPLLQELIAGCSEWYETPKGLLLIQSVYDTSHIFSTFRRVRSILANGSYTFLRYVYQTDISEMLDQQRAKITTIDSKLINMEEKFEEVVISEEPPILEPVLPKALQRNNKRELVVSQRMSYLDLLVIVAVKYIEGHAVESMGVQFYLGNAGVNASAVELVETLLNYLDNPILSEKLVNYIIMVLLKVMHQVVVNQEYIMQIQLLHLIRNIFFDSAFRKKAEPAKVREFFKKVFTDNVFLKSILSGLQTAFAYVRSQFISFITVCIPLIADFLDPDECTDCIRRILFTYYELIKDIGRSIGQSVVEEAEQINEEQEGRISQMPSMIEAGLRDKLEQKGGVRLSENLKKISKTNQILSVLQGVEAILNYFFDLNKVNPKELGFQFSNPYTFLDTFKSIITLGLASSSKQGTLIEKKNFLHNFDTCEALLKDLQPVYETILRSWPLSEEYVRIASEEFSSAGMCSFSFGSFSRYNGVVVRLMEWVEGEKESIWGKIYSIMQPMFCRFPKEIIDIYLKLWMRECSDVNSQNGRIFSEPDRTELLMKIMETIIVNNFPMKIVVHAFLESSPLENLVEKYSKKNNKKGTILDYETDKAESKLLYFVYVYFNYVYLNQKELSYEPLLEIWSLIMKALKPFEQSRSPLAAIWIVEIANMCAKKYSPKELLGNQRFKTDLHALVNSKLRYIAGIAGHSETVFFGDPGLKKKMEDSKSTQSKYHIVLPLPPTLYETHRKSSEKRNNTDHLMSKQFAAGDGRAIEHRCRIMCFKILKSLGLEVLQNIYAPEKNHWVVRRTVEWLDLILPVIEDKSTMNMSLAQCASQVLYDLLDKARVLFIRQIRGKVLEIFNKNDFFICSVNTLRYWASIVDWVVSTDKHHETYFEYLNKVTLSSSYFTSESAENRKRIKSFERVCFILYAGGKDKYATKVKFLLQKVVEVIRKPQTAHAALLVLVLFSVRIMMLRLSEVSLNQLFLDIWPNLLALLMQTFSKQLVRVHINNQIPKNPNYLLAALKLVEMISISNLTEFSYHQWIFITDYFGVDLALPELTTEMMETYSKRPQLTSLIPTRNEPLKESPFAYQPVLLNYTPACSLSYLPRHHQVTVESSYQPPKRTIVIKESFVRDESELRLNAVLLMQYLASLNEARIQVDWEEVEEVIVSDFICLDSFIHQIS